MRRSLKSGAFDRVLAQPAISTSAHFALHFERSRLAEAAKRSNARINPELSTEPGKRIEFAVDNNLSLSSSQDGWRLGIVVPKRYAALAVTRNMLKREIRAGAGRYAPEVGTGICIVRLRASIDQGQSSPTGPKRLRDAVRIELDALLAKAVQSIQMGETHA